MSKNLANEINSTLSRAIPSGAACALIDFPDHSNVGDSAIWLGERVFLKNHGIPIKYMCRHDTFDEASLRRAMPTGTILIHGGGNFGTLWTQHQKLRESIIERLTDYKIVQLPQSIYYDDQQALDRTQKFISSHPDFTLLVRDRASLKIGLEGLTSNTFLCPDSALLLGDLLERSPAQADCLILARTDLERSVDQLDHVLQGTPYSVESADWLTETRTPGILAVRALMKLAGHKLPSRIYQRSLLAACDGAARQRVTRGCRLLSRGRVVITDRLHAHILCVLLGIPHVILDNNYGKVRGFVEEWMSDNPLCHQAGDRDEAAVIAARLLSASTTLKTVIQ